MRDFVTEIMLMMWLLFGQPIPADHDTSHCEWGVIATTKSGFEIGGWICTFPVRLPTRSRQARRGDGDE